uniref:U1-type domain-containing protein n=1 Tax=Strigamia maritima TaxID=126957 RepID=T1JGB3_STRMM
MADHRRKWNREEYEQKAEKRKQDEDEAAEGKKIKSSPKVPLQARKYRVDLDSKIGKSSIVSKTTNQSQSGGYFCDVCDCCVKDSMNYLDHINSKKHQENLGMKMEPERSSLESVKNRFQAFKQKKEQNQKGTEYNLESRLKQVTDYEEKEKETKREKRKAKKRKAAEAMSEFADVDPEMTAVMGLTG